MHSDLGFSSPPVRSLRLPGPRGFQQVNFFASDGTQAPVTALVVLVAGGEQEDVRLFFVSRQPRQAGVLLSHKVHLCGQPCPPKLTFAGRHSRSLCGPKILLLASCSQERARAVTAHPENDHHLEISHAQIRRRRTPLLVRGAGSGRVSRRLLQLRQFLREAGR
jgi:hypothetical protein